MVEQLDTDSGDGFSEEWLTLREPADHAARSEILTQQLAEWVRRQPALHIMEMGCGTGSNLRYLCPHLGHDQQWTLLDYDETLLSHLPVSIQHWAVNIGVAVDYTDGVISLSHSDFSASVRWQQADLANELETLPFETTQLITASALLDLTSRTWLEKLADSCIRNQCASLFVLNYDGDISWQPPVESDALTRQLLNEHQLSDKGFGPALGPRAGHTLAQLMKSCQQVSIQQSDWQISARQQALQTALIDGWVEAATEIAPADKDLLYRWHAERSRNIASMDSSLTVGHTDILSLPVSDHSTTG